MCDQFCQPCYEEWCIDAVTLGRIDGFNGDMTDLTIRRALTRCNWSGASAGSLDPQKEVAAAEAKVNAGFSTIEREAMELNGSNWRDNVTQQATEKDTFTEADLTFPPERKAATLGAGKVFPTPSPEQGQPAARTTRTIAIKATRRSRSTNHTLSLSGAIMR